MQVSQSSIDWAAPDTDGDGYSDADDEWLASPNGEADAFPKNRVQWADSDGDGFGDNPIGAIRDDCPINTGTSTIDVQGCPDGNGDGYSDDYGAVRSQLALMGSNPHFELVDIRLAATGFPSDIVYGPPL